MLADAEAHGENINSEYKRKGKRKISTDDTTRDSTRSTLKRAIREAAGNRFREEEWLQQQRDRAIGIGASFENFRRTTQIFAKKIRVRQKPCSQTCI